MSDVHDLLVQLTRDAIEAARDGKWDHAIFLYNQRLALGGLQGISPEIIRSLIEWDQWLIARVQEVRAAIHQNLLDIQDQRRQLEALKRQWGGNTANQARHLLTV